MIRIIAIASLLIFCINFHADAQKKNPYMFDRTIKRDKRVREPWLPQNMRYARAGWFFSPGVTYTMVRFKNFYETHSEDDAFRTDVKFNPNSRFAYYLEGGRYRIFNRGFFKYVDYGLAVKRLSGRELMEGQLVDKTDNTILADYESDGKFRNDYAGAFVNLNHVHTVGSFNFIQNSIGLNLDYRWRNKYDYETTLAVPTNNVEGPNPLVFQLHYKLGWGIRVSKKLMVIPTAEVPLLNIVKFEQFKSTHNWFSSRYRPLIFTVRFLFLRDANKTECPPVYTNPDDVNKEDGQIWN